MKYKWKWKIEFKRKEELSGILQPYMAFYRDRRKTVILICAAVFFIAAVDLASTAAHDGMYVRSSDGAVQALRVDDDKTVLSFPVKVTAEKDGTVAKLETILSFGEQSGGTAGKEPTAEENLKKALRDVSRQVEAEEGSLIQLPTRLGDGIRLTWSGGKTSSLPAVLMLLPLCLGLLYQSSRQKEKEAARRKTDDIRRQLPAFNSQLLLLLGSGLIFNDAFTRISEGYSSQNNGGYLAQVVQEIQRETAETGSSLVTVLGRRSKEIGVREFSRLAGIITDNQHKGVNLTDKLENESEMLWNQRKKLAEERGRAAETKLSFPLAILLLVLILVTASPAVLQM